MLSNKRWEKSENLLAEYQNCMTYVVGVREVPVSDIIGLGLWPPEELARDTKMQRLRQFVMDKGWDDRTPQDLHLYRLPNGKYVVGSGGNHRPVLADELNIEKIYAAVEILLPIDEMDAEGLQRITMLESKIKDLEVKAQEVVLKRRRLGIRWDESDENVREYEAVFDELDSAEVELREVKRGEAVGLGYL